MSLVCPHWPRSYHRAADECDLISVSQWSHQPEAAVLSLVQLTQQLPCLRLDGFVLTEDWWWPGSQSVIQSESQSSGFHRTARLLWLKSSAPEKRACHWVYKGKQSSGTTATARKSFSEKMSNSIFVLDFYQPTVELSFSTEHNSNIVCCTPDRHKCCGMYN